MKSAKLFLAGILFSAVPMLSYSQAVQPGQFTFSAGYGFPNFLRTALNTFEGENTYSSTVIGPVFGKFEYRASDVVGFGIDAAFSQAKASYETTSDTSDIIKIYNTDLTYTSYSILGRINFHFAKSEKFDAYSGIGLGYRNTLYRYHSEDPNFSKAGFDGFNHFGFDFTLGVRYYFTDNIGIYGELGLAKAPIQAGLAIKF